MAVNYNGSPIPISLGGHAYDPYAEYINAGYLGSAGSQLQRAQSFMAPGSENYFANYAAGSPFNQQYQLNQLVIDALSGNGPKGNLISGMFNNAGSGGTGGVGNENLSSYLSLFDLNRQRAQQGLQDQFTAAGGASSLSGPFERASQQLEQGLGQTEQGSLVDLDSRLIAPRIAAQSQNFSTIASILGALLR